MPARTVGAAGLAEVRAKQAGPRLRTVPASRARSPAARSTRAPAADGVRRGTTRDQGRRGPVVRARVRRLAERHARPPETDHAGPVGLLPAANPERPRAASPSSRNPASGEHRSTRPSASSEPRSSRSSASGEYRSSRSPASGAPRSSPSRRPASGEYRGRSRPRTMACLVLPHLLARPAKAPASGPQRAAGLAVRRREASAATPRRAATSVAAGGQRTPDHGGPPQVTQGAARGPQMKGRRPHVMAAVIGHRRPCPRHRGQPAAGQATAGQATAGHNRAGARDQARPGVRRPDEAPARGHCPGYEPGRMFRTRLALTSSTRKRGLS